MTASLLLVLAATPAQRNDNPRRVLFVHIDHAGVQQAPGVNAGYAHPLRAHR